MKMEKFAAVLAFDTFTDEGTFRGVAAVFNNIAQAEELDILVPGAFKRTLDHWSGKPIPFFWWHDHEDRGFPVGSIMRAWESERGLEIEGAFDLTTEKARDAYNLAKHGHATGLSIGFLPIPNKTEHKKAPNGSVYRYLKEVRLFEVSLLPQVMAADQGAMLETVHAAAGGIQIESGKYKTEALSKAITEALKSGEIRAAAEPTGKDEWIKWKTVKLIDEGKDADQAYAEANSTWDEMQKEKHAVVPSIQKHATLDHQSVMDQIRNLAKSIIECAKEPASDLVCVCCEACEEPHCMNYCPHCYRFCCCQNDIAKMQIGTCASMISQLCYMPTPNYPESSPDSTSTEPTPDPAAAEMHASTQQKPETKQALGGEKEKEPEPFTTATAVRELAEVTRQFARQYDSRRTADTSRTGV